MPHQPLPLPPWAVQACRLWRRSAPGTAFSLSGVWGGVRVHVFENPDKRDADDADFILCIASPARRSGPATTDHPTTNPTENKS